MCIDRNKKNATTRFSYSPRETSFQLHTTTSATVQFHPSSTSSFHTIPGYRFPSYHSTNVFFTSFFSPSLSFVSPFFCFSLLLLPFCNRYDGVQFKLTPFSLNPRLFILSLSTAGGRQGRRHQTRTPLDATATLECTFLTTYFSTILLRSTPRRSSSFTANKKFILFIAKSRVNILLLQIRGGSFFS